MRKNEHYPLRASCESVFRGPAMLGALAALPR
jgi:hypothetical protein